MMTARKAVRLLMSITPMILKQNYTPTTKGAVRAGSLSMAAAVILVVLLSVAVLVPADAYSQDVESDGVGHPNHEGCVSYHHDHNGWTSTHWHQLRRRNYTTNDGRVVSICTDDHPPTPTEPPLEPDSRNTPRVTHVVQPDPSLDPSGCDAPKITELDGGKGELQIEWEQNDTRCSYQVQYAYYTLTEDEDCLGRTSFGDDDCSVFTIGEDLRLGSLIYRGAETAVHTSVPTSHRIAAVRIRASNGETRSWGDWDYLGNAQNGQHSNFCYNQGQGRGRPLRYICANAAHLVPSQVQQALKNRGLGDG